jgi:hypothetical protein
VIGIQFPLGHANVDQSSSFLKVTGSMDVTYGIGGVGVIDISSANKGNPAFSDECLIRLSGQRMIVGARRVRTACDAYIEITYKDGHSEWHGR